MPMTSHDHGIGEDDPIINENDLQENYFNVNNNVITEVNGEREEDNEPINNENEGVGYVSHIVRIEDYNDDDPMLEDAHAYESDDNRDKANN